MPTHFINRAIRDCLDRCYASENPLSIVADYVARLRSDPQWNGSDVDQVEVAVRHILKAVVAEPQANLQG